MIDRDTSRTYSEEQARAAIRGNGLWESVFEVGQVENGSHWHDFDAHLYILEGTLYLTDVEADRVHECTPGTKVVVPAATLHAEKSSGYTVLVGSSKDPATFGERVDRPPEERPAR